MKTTKTVAVIPVKRFSEAKSRLAGSLTPEQRAGLAEEMLHHVLETLRESGVIAEIAVVSPDPEISLPAWVTLLHQATTGLNAGLWQGREWAMASGAEALLVLLSDLPMLSPEDITSIARLGAEEGTVVLAPDRHGQGTNAMFAHPPSLARFAFGVSSFGKHRTLATEVGARVLEYLSPGTTVDVDTPEDLALVISWMLAAILAVSAGLR